MNERKIKQQKKRIKITNNASCKMREAIIQKKIML